VHGEAPRAHQRPHGRRAVTALAVRLRGLELAAEVRDDLSALRTRAHVAVTSTPSHQHGLPVETHAHAHTAEDEKPLFLRLHTQLLSQVDELDQSVWAVEHSDLGARHRLLDLTPPLVDHVRGESTRVRG